MSENNARDLFPGALEMMVLRLLKQRPMHGYALVQRIQQASNNLCKSEGAVPGASTTPQGRSGRRRVGRVVDESSRAHLSNYPHRLQAPRPGSLELRAHARGDQPRPRPWR